MKFPGKTLHANPHRADLLAAAGCGFFFLAGLVFVPRLGIEDDEALFGTVFYEPYGGIYYYRLGHTHWPIMILSYLGALKSWAYRLLFISPDSGLFALRIPALVAGAASIWLFYRLMVRLAGKRAALIGCGLLATDSMYLLTTCFDWGPVALQHLLLLSGMLALVAFWQNGSKWVFGAAFFLFGLAVWDKALAFWNLSSMLLAALITVPRQIFGAMTIRRLAVAVLTFSLGALPLILFNVHSHGGTLLENASLDTDDLPGKARLARETLRGSPLFGWMVAENNQTPAPRGSKTVLQKFSAQVAGLTGNPRRSWQFYAFCLALVLAPLAARPAAVELCGELAKNGPSLRLILFASITIIVAWCQMAFNAHTGGGVHHVILLWPLPQMLIATSFAAASYRLGRIGRPVVAVLVLMVMGSGLLVMNQYHAAMVRNGGAISWSNAIFPLATSLKRIPARYIFCLDWGYLDPLRLLSKNQLPVRVGPAPMERDRQLLMKFVSAPDAIFVAHTPNFEFFRDLNARFIAFAEQAGYQREMLGVISDSYGRPTFEIYRLQTVPAASQEFSKAQ